MFQSHHISSIGNIIDFKTGWAAVHKTPVKMRVKLFIKKKNLKVNIYPSKIYTYHDAEFEHVCADISKRNDESRKKTPPWTTFPLFYFFWGLKLVVFPL